MSIKSNIARIKAELDPQGCTLVAVTKMHPVSELEQLYETGHRIFGENRVQELVPKYEALPKDIHWHLIGHLQSNKVKYIAHFIDTIHSIDSFKLLEEVNKQAQKHNRVISCFLQMYIAKEETKFGLDEAEALEILKSASTESLQNVKICGLMGMATNTDNVQQVRTEFKNLRTFFDSIKSIKTKNIELTYLSMGMSSDYKIALEEGSNVVRIGSAIFG